MPGGRVRKRKLITEGYEGAFGDDGNGLYLDYDGCCSGVHMCQSHGTV